MSVSADAADYGTLWSAKTWWYGPWATNNYIVKDGIMSLITSNTGSCNGCIWSYGWFYSPLTTWADGGRGFSQRYGYWEARIKVAKGNGLVNTFYLESLAAAEHLMAPWTEFDIFEIVGQRPDYIIATLRSGTGGAFENWQPGVWQPGGIGDLSADFHTYGLLWEKDSNVLTWYLDGQPIGAPVKFATTDATPMIMYLNVDANSWDGLTDNTTPNPSTMQIDWVRVWSNDPNVPMWSAGSPDGN
jgi:beta-glucanase (GH16 family)